VYNSYFKDFESEKFKYEGLIRKGPSEGFEPSSSGFCLKLITSSSPQPPILTRLYYEGHFISCAIIVLYIISKSGYQMTT
jgi:hypothetical protein